MEDSGLRQLQDRIMHLEKRVQFLEHKLGHAPREEQAPQAVQPPPAPQPSAPKPKPVSAPRESWEQRIGGTWLNRIGVVALLIGLAFFMKFAFDNWIDERGRVAIGYTLGALLLAGGFWYRRKMPKFGSSLGGAGIGAWFISTWAAYSFYQLFAPLPALVVMGVVTVAGVALALYWNSPALASLGLLGGYLTPIIIHGVGGHMTQFFFLLVLNIGALAVLVKKNWNGLAFISLGFTALINLIALVTLYEEQFLLPFMLFISAYHLLFAIQGLSANLLHRSATRPPVLGVSLASGVIYLLFSAALLYGDHPRTLALIVLAWGVFYLIQVAAVHKWRSSDRSLSFVLLSLALGYITIAAPIGFSGARITMIWAVQAAILIAVGWKTQATRLRGWGLIVLFLAVWRLAAFDLKLLSSVTVLLRWGYIAPWAARLPVLILTVAVMLLAAWVCAKKDVTKFERGLVPLLIIGANLLSLVFVLGEWSRWYYHLQIVLDNWSAYRNTAWTLTMAGNLVLLLVLWVRWRYRPLKILILVLLPMAMLWSVFVDTRVFSMLFMIVSPVSPWAGRLPGVIMLTLLSFLAVGLMGRNRMGWLITFANVFLLLVVLTEFSRYFYGLRDSLVQPWQVYRNTAWSATMGIHGFLLVATGIWRKFTLLRRLGILLLLITAAKITLVDLTGLETVLRILVFVGTGVVMIIASWLYQKYVSPGLEK